jgi:hypothetical protein
MKTARSEYIIDSLVMSSFVGDGSLHKFAQEGIMSSLAGGIKNYVKSLYNPAEPIASVAAFIGPGLLFKMGFPLIGVFYEVAEALGFNWIGFWHTVGEDVVEFLKAITSSGQKPSEDVFSGKIDSIVQSAAGEHFQGQPDMSKLTNLIKQKFAKRDIKDVAILKAFAIQYLKDNSIVKNAGLGSITAKLSRFFIRAIKWIMKTALLSLGFAAGGGALSTLINGPEGPNKEEGSSSSYEGGGGSSSQMAAIPFAPVNSPDLLTWHKNDLHGLWMERGDANQVQSTLLSWVLSAYPQLNQYESELQNSNAFREMTSRFAARNSMAAGLDIFSVPKPYQRKLDIVNQIVGGFLAEHPIQANPPQQTNENVSVQYK